MASFWGRTMAGIRAFREAFMYPDLDGEVSTDYGDFDNRKARNDLLWAYYMGNAYREALHSWSRSMKATFGLYKYTRDLYNPAYELGQFYRINLWGGYLDAAAGDGKQEPSALPIYIPDTTNEATADALRQSISLFWQWSNWGAQRNRAALHGSVLGDAFIQIVDNTQHERVYAKIVHPSLIKLVDEDDFGFVKGYVIEYERMQPGTINKVIYTEIVSRDGDNVVYETFANGKPQAWGDAVDDSGNAASTWSVPYGFVPMVHIRHNDMGLDWGVSEMLPHLGLFREVDDQASKLNDYVRKTVDAPWLLAGVEKPVNNPQASGRAATENRPEPGREETPMLYSRDANAKPHPMIAPLDIEATGSNIDRLLGKLENVYPELALSKLRASGSEMSGRAIRLIQRDAEAKVQTYRGIYDSALVRLQQMAVAIGGWRGYEGFEGFGLDSYNKGDLTHAIGKRPVFANDPLDEEELESARVKNVEGAVRSGWPLDVYLRARDYYDEDTLAALVGSEEYQAKLALLTMQAGAENG